MPLSEKEKALVTAGALCSDPAVTARALGPTADHETLRCLQSQLLLMLDETPVSHLEAVRQNEASSVLADNMAFLSPRTAATRLTELATQCAAARNQLTELLDAAAAVCRAHPEEVPAETVLARIETWHAELAAIDPNPTRDVLGAVAAMEEEVRLELDTSGVALRMELDAFEAREALAAAVESLVARLLPPRDDATPLPPPPLPKDTLRVSMDFLEAQRRWLEATASIAAPLREFTARTVGVRAVARAAAPPDHFEPGATRDDEAAECQRELLRHVVWRATWLRQPSALRQATMKQAEAMVAGSERLVAACEDLDRRHELRKPPRPPYVPLAVEPTGVRLDAAAPRTADEDRRWRAELERTFYTPLRGILDEVEQLAALPSSAAEVVAARNELERALDRLAAALTAPTTRAALDPTAALELERIIDGAWRWLRAHPQALVPSLTTLFRELRVCAADAGLPLSAVDPLETQAPPTADDSHHSPAGSAAQRESDAVTALACRLLQEVRCVRADPKPRYPTSTADVIALREAVGVATRAFEAHLAQFVLGDTVVIGAAEVEGEYLALLDRLLDLGVKLPASSYAVVAKE